MRIINNLLSTILPYNTQITIISQQCTQHVSYKANSNYNK